MASRRNDNRKKVQSDDEGELCSSESRELLEKVFYTKDTKTRHDELSEKLFNMLRGLEKVEKDGDLVKAALIFIETNLPDLYCVWDSRKGSDNRPNHMIVIYSRKYSFNTNIYFFVHSFKNSFFIVNFKKLELTFLSGMSFLIGLQTNPPKYLKWLTKYQFRYRQQPYNLIAKAVYDLGENKKEEDSRNSESQNNPEPGIQKSKIKKECSGKCGRKNYVFEDEDFKCKRCNLPEAPKF